MWPLTESLWTTLYLTFYRWTKPLTLSSPWCRHQRCLTTPTFDWSSPISLFTPLFFFFYYSHLKDLQTHAFSYLYTPLLTTFYVLVSPSLKKGILEVGQNFLYVGSFSSSFFLPLPRYLPRYRSSSVTSPTPNLNPHQNENSRDLSLEWYYIFSLCLTRFILKHKKLLNPSSQTCGF